MKRDMTDLLKFGYFSNLAIEYSQCPSDFCLFVPNGLHELLDKTRAKVDFFDVGTGTGIVTRMVLSMGVCW